MSDRVCARAVSLLVLIAYLLQASPIAHAVESSETYRMGGRADSQTGYSLGAEYIFRNDMDEVLIPVYVLGAVSKPGLYHIPSRTDLLTLLALSGGPSQEADAHRISIKSGTGQVRLIDLDRLVSESTAVSPGAPRSPALANNDVVYLKTKEPWFSSNAVTLITLLTGVVGIVLTSIVISQQTKK